MLDSDNNVITFSFTVNEDGTIKFIEEATIELWDEEGKLIEVGITDSDGLLLVNGCRKKKKNQ